MIASKRHLHSSIAMLGVIATLLLAFGFASSTAYAEELEAAQINAGDSEAAQADANSLEAAQQADSSAAKAWDLPKDAEAKKASNRSALTTQAADGVVELAGSKLTVQSSADSFQFVLTWGELPYDLDSHMEGYTPNGESIHVYYSNSSESYSGDAYCTLDHDDTNSYGPETVDLKSSSQYPCYYYVHNYSEGPNICTSHAVVKVYKNGQLMGIKKVPTWGSGLYWNICAVQNGEITWYDDVVERSSITDEPNLGYITFHKWTTTSQGKRSYPDYGHKYGRLDHFLTSTADVAKVYKGFAKTVSTGAYPIPGLEYSSAGGGCDAMVPQGVCVASDYIVVTGYCAGDLLLHMSNYSKKSSADKKYVNKDLRKHNLSGSNHNPALYVLDRATGSYVATVEIKGIDDNHVGGIAYDGTNLLVATSTRKSGGNLQELKIPYSTFEASLSNRDTASVSMGSGGVQLVSLNKSAGYINSASYNTYDPATNILWVGNNKADEGKSCQVVGFKESNGAYEPVINFIIPDKANGMAIANVDGSKYLLLGVSDGRKKSSHVYCWDITDLALGANLNNIAKTGNIELPPMLEELCVSNGSLYSVYESGATVYGCFDGPTVYKKTDKYGNVTYPTTDKGRAVVSVDVVCEAPVSDVLHAKISGTSDKPDKTRISVACPVIVKLLNADGDVVGRIEDDWADDDYGDDDVIAWVDGDVKSFLVPSDREYTLDIIATDDGTMDVTAVQYDSEGNVNSMVTYADVALTEDVTHSASLATLEGDAVISSRFALAGPEGETVTPSETAEGDMEKCQVTVVTEGDGSASESAQVVKSDYHCVVAEPDDGTVFDGWYVGDEQVCSENTYEFWVLEDTELVARFSTPDYAISHVSVEGNGSIDSSNPGATVDQNVELRAVPDEDGWFDGWYADGEFITDDEHIDFYAVNDGELVAKFKPATIASVHVAAGGNGLGEVELLENDGKVGGKATVSAYAHNRATFEGWHLGSADGALVSTDTVYTFTIEGDTLLVANFIDGPEQRATVTVKALGSGVVKAGTDEAAEVVTELSFPIEDELTLVAVPDGDDAYFNGWVVNGERFGSDAQTTLTIMEDTEVVAWFSGASIKVNAVVVGDHEGEVDLSPTSAEITGPESVEFGIDYDYDLDDFLGWYSNGELISNNRWVYVRPTEDMTLEAHMRKASYANVTVNYDSSLGYVWKDFGNPVRVGSTIYLDADWDYGATFDGWFINGECVGTYYYLDYEVTGDVTIEARFSKYTIDVSDADIYDVPTYTYDGSAKKPVPTVVLDGDTLTVGRDFTISYKNNTNAGTATLTITGQGDYAGTKSVDFTIKKAKQSITAKAAKKTFKVSKAKVKKKALSLKKTITVKGNVGAVSYTNVSTKKALKKFKVNAKNGTIKVPKGTKKGTYKIKVNVTVAATANYVSASAPVTVKIVVK